MKKSNQKFKKLILPLLIFIIVFAIYRIFVYYELLIGMWIYLGISSALFLAFVIVNRSFSLSPTDRSLLPNEWTEEEKNIYLLDESNRHKNGKIILLILMPFFMTLLIDMIELYVIDYFKELLSNII